MIGLACFRQGKQWFSRKIFQNGGCLCILTVCFEILNDPGQVKLRKAFMRMGSGQLLIDIQKQLSIGFLMNPVALAQADSGEFKDLVNQLWILACMIGFFIQIHF